jgi:hypothetical protein
MGGIPDLSRALGLASQDLIGLPEQVDDFALILCLGVKQGIFQQQHGGGMVSRRDQPASLGDDLALARLGALSPSGCRKDQGKTHHHPSDRLSHDIRVLLVSMRD